MWNIFVLILICSLAICIENLEQLSESIYPIRYELELTPYFVSEKGKNEFSFDGSVIILVKVETKGVKEIRLDFDSKWLNLTSSPKISELASPSNIIEAKSNILKKEEVLLLSFDRELIKTTYVLTIDFSGEMRRNHQHGFYVQFFEKGRKTEFIAATQFQYNYARSVFPCFDQPRFKATFSLIINRPIEFGPTLSNSQIARSKMLTGGTRIREEFNLTPIMSTYLLAFVLAKYESRSFALSNVTIHASPDIINETDYALNTAVAVMKMMNDVFEYNYFSVPGVEKMSIVAIPSNDFAMENWGLITIFESGLMFNSSYQTVYDRQLTKTVIVHEMAHQWLGNLVTCQSWEYLWLNEGFARFYEYFLTQKMEPEWQLDWQFTDEHLHSILNYETHGDKHDFPLNSYEINLSYDKGASILRMVENIMGKSEFKKAIREYIRLK